MIWKMFEVRDRGTFIPVIGFLLTTDNEREIQLLARAGFSYKSVSKWHDSDFKFMLYINLCTYAAQCDPYDWPDRTNHCAHKYIQENWFKLDTGSVIDVEFILGETKTRKESEIHDA